MFPAALLIQAAPCPSWSPVPMDANRSYSIHYKPCDHATPGGKQTELIVIICRLLFLEICCYAAC